MDESDDKGLGELVALVESREELADYISALRKDLAENQEAWESWTLDSYLGAMERFVRAMDRAYAYRKAPLPSAEAWRTVADILYAAKIYE